MSNVVKSTTSLESLRSYLILQLAKRVDCHQNYGSAFMHEMQCAAYLDVWDLLFHKVSEPYWHDMWLQERRKQRGDESRFLAVDNPLENLPHSPDDDKRARAHVIKSIATIGETLSCQQPSLSEWAALACSAIDYLIHSASAAVDRFPAANQLEEYLISIMDIRGFIIGGSEGASLVFKVYFKLIANMRSSVPGAWRKLSTILSKKDYASLMQTSAKLPHRKNGPLDYAQLVTTLRTILREKNIIIDRQ